MNRIEVIGPSGSGKSFSLKKLKRNSKPKFFKLFLHFLKLKVILFVFFVFFLIIDQVFFYSKHLNFFSKIKLFSKNLKYLFLFIINAEFKYYFLKGDRIIDEGYLQYFISLIENPKSVSKYFNYYKYFCPNLPQKIIVHSPLNKDVLILNMNKRKRWPRRNLGKKYFNNLLSNQIIITNFLIKEYEKNSELSIKINRIK